MQFVYSNLRQREVSYLGNVCFWQFLIFLKFQSSSVDFTVVFVLEWFQVHQLLWAWPKIHVPRLLLFLDKVLILSQFPLPFVFTLRSAGTTTWTFWYISFSRLTATNQIRFSCCNGATDIHLRKKILRRAGCGLRAVVRNPDLDDQTNVVRWAPYCFESYNWIYLGILDVTLDKMFHAPGYRSILVCSIITGSTMFDHVPN